MFVVAAARLAIATLVACVVAGWGVLLVCWATVGGVHRLGRPSRARPSPPSDEPSGY
jgi:hypothetical protein